METVQVSPAARVFPAQLSAATLSSAASGPEIDAAPGCTDAGPGFHTVTGTVSGTESVWAVGHLMFSGSTTALPASTGSLYRISPNASSGPPAHVCSNVTHRLEMIPLGWTVISWTSKFPVGAWHPTPVPVIAMYGCVSSELPSCALLYAPAINGCPGAAPKTSPKPFVPSSA